MSDKYHVAHRIQLYQLAHAVRIVAQIKGARQLARSESVKIHRRTAVFFAEDVEYSAKTVYASAPAVQKYDILTFALDNMIKNDPPRRAA